MVRARRPIARSGPRWAHQGWLRSSGLGQLRHNMLWFDVPPHRYDSVLYAGLRNPEPFRVYPTQEMPTYCRRFLESVLLAVATSACDKNVVEPPITTTGPAVTVTGAERLGWTQNTADPRELSTFRFAIYVD